MKLLPLLSATGILLLPVHGFSPTSSSRTTSLLPTSRQAATNVGKQRHHLRENQHQHNHGSPVAAFTSTSTSTSSTTRRFFTPKSDAESSSDKPFIRPALHNSPFFRSLAILYALLFAIYQSSSATAPALHKLGKYLILPPNIAATVHLLSFSTWFGTVVYTTFVTGITMFKNLPRRVFGTLQSKLFPLYFKLCSVMIGVQVSLFFLLLLATCMTFHEIGSRVFKYTILLPCAIIGISLLYATFSIGCTNQTSCQTYSSQPNIMCVDPNLNRHARHTLQNLRSIPLHRLRNHTPKSTLPRTKVHTCHVRSIFPRR
mmetsp:Transcript_32908/g.62880  ORF Transcript_32908/g.62880 Transcript_32908/m.62880 type:complete len:315 (-) Transcript_32908:1903-2847(-)